MPVVEMATAGRDAGDGVRGGETIRVVLPKLELKNERGSCWTWGLVFLFVLSIILTLLFFWGVRASMVNQVKSQLSPEEYAEMEKWLATEVSFPEEWAEPEPFSQDLIDRAEEIRPVVEYWMDPAEEIKSQLKSPGDPVIKKLRDGQELTEEEWAHARELEKEAQPLLEAIAHFVGTPDYEIGALSLLDYENDDNRLTQGIDIQLFNLIVHRIELKASLLAREGKWDEAFQEMALLYRLSHRHPASKILTHLLGTNTEIMFARRLQDFATQCGEAIKLRAPFNEIKGYRTKFPEEFLDSTFSLENIGYLHHAARLGYEVDLTPGQKNASYLNQYGDLIVNEEKADPNALDWNSITMWFTPIEFIYRQSKPDYSETKGRFFTGEAALRLVKIGVANRIRELEGGGSISDLDGLDPTLLPEVPEDPFSGNAFLWDASSELFYSVGPDLEDDRNLILYSPTNGVVSKGDYSLK